MQTLSQSTSNVSEEAARWAVRLDQGDLSAFEHARFQRWVLADPLHQAAFVEQSSLAAMAAELPADLRGRLIALDAPSPAIEPALATRPQRAGGDSSRRRWALGASLSATVLILMAIALWHFMHAPVEPRSYAAAAGEHQRFTLDDGSTMTLNASSEARVRSTGGHHTVELIQGEALFDGMHDATHPLVVTAGKITVQPVGTKFSVRVEDAGSVSVLVSDGKVTISGPYGGRTAGPATFTRVWETRYLQTPVGPTELMGRLAWSTGELVFTNTTLEEAVTEVNRYSRRQLKVCDEALASAHVVGSFRIDSLDSFRDALQRLGAVTFRADGADPSVTCLVRAGK